MCKECKHYKQEVPAGVEWLGRHADVMVEVEAKGSCHFPLPFYIESPWVQESDGVGCPVWEECGKNV